MLKQALKLEARLVAMEHLLCNLAASVLVSNGKTTADVDDVVKATLDAMRRQGLGGFGPEVSDSLINEIEDAVARLYQLVNQHMKVLNESSSRNMPEVH